MGVLSNLQHERFCQEFHRLGCARGKRLAAYIAAGFAVGKKARKPAANARRLVNSREIKARLSELAAETAKISALDAGWAQLQLCRMVEANLDDYLGPKDENGNRAFEIGSVSREKLQLLSELLQEEETELRGGEDDPHFVRVRKVKLKLPDKIAALRLMAEIGGWKAPTKSEYSGPDGGPIETKEISELDAVRRINFLLRKAANATSKEKQ